MTNINKVVLVGKAGGDAEIKTAASGTEFAKVSIATKVSIKTDKDITSWHSVVAWTSDLVERAKDIKTGDLVFVEGSLNYFKYEERTISRVNAYKLDVLVHKDPEDYLESNHMESEEITQRETESEENSPPF